jgi:hypothetical protein
MTPRRSKPRPIGEGVASMARGWAALALGVLRLPAHARASADREPLRWAMASVALAASAASAWILHIRTDRAADYWDLFALWVGAMALYVGATFRRSAWQGLASRRTRTMVLEAAALFAVASVLRLPFLATAPEILSGDEGTNGLAALARIDGHGSMFETLNAYGTLYYFVLAASMRVFGDTMFALRLPGAIAGSLGVAFTYLLARHCFGRRVGLATGILLAASHTHVHFSRVAHGQSIDTAVGALALALFLRGLDRRSPGWMALAGVVLGLAQYGYVGGRVIDVVVAAMVLLLAVLDPRRIAAALGPIFVAFGGALVAALPMVRWMLDRPEEYFSRLNQVGLLKETGLSEQAKAAGTTVWGLVARQVAVAWDTLLTRPVTGFYQSAAPMMDGIWAALFILGFAYALMYLRDRRFLGLALHVAGGVVILATVENPYDSTYRATGILLSAAVLGAWALVALADRGSGTKGTSGRSDRGGPAAARPRPADLIVALVTAVVAAINIGQYQIRYLPACRYADPGTGAASLAAVYIRERAGDRTVLGLTDSSLTNFPSVTFLSRRQALRWPPPADVAPPGATGSEGYIYALDQGSGALRDVAPNEPVLVLVSPVRRDQVLGADGGGGWELEATLDRCGTPTVEAYSRGAMP